MKLISPQLTALTTVLVSLACFPAAAAELADGPDDLTATRGGTVTFSVEPRLGELSYQWFRWDVSDYVELTGETNRTLTLANVDIPDVALYVCRITQGDRFEFSRAAALCVAVQSAQQTTASKLQPGGGSIASMIGGGGPITLYGPVLVSGGTQGTCPGPYAGYVIYMKPAAQGWGWTPNSDTYHAASDPTRSDTTVTYVGKFFDSGCALTTVVLPHPPMSSKYRFTIFFPDNVPTTNAYPIALEGFDP